MQQVNDDFSGGVKDLEETMKDLKTAFDAAKSADKKAIFFDEFKQIVKNYPAQIAAGLDFAPAPRANKWAHSFAELMSEAVEFNPQNAQEMFTGALKIEQNSANHNNGILLQMADKIVSKYAKQKNKNIKQNNEAIKQTKIVLTALMEHWKDYGKSGQLDAATCKKFYEICTQAYPIVPSILPVANEIHTETEFLEGGYKLGKDIQIISQKPDDEAAKETFANHFKSALNHNPQEAVADLVSNIKSISRIDNTEAREDIYCAICDAMQKDFPAEIAKSDMAFTVVGKIMKAEKDDEVRKNFALSAVELIQKVATDENGALAMEAGREMQAFGALEKLADACGHRGELLQLLSNSAEKYKDTPEILQKVKDVTIRALDSADDSGQKMIGYQEPDFIKEMRPVQKELRAIKMHDKEICELLNLEYAGHKFDPSKPLKPNKETLSKAINILGQYKSIDPLLFSWTLNKADTKEFTNIDDKMLDTLSKVVDRIKVREPEERKKYANMVTETRKMVHAHILEQKKADANADAKPPHFVEKRENKTEKPKFVIKFSKDDINQA